MRRTSRGSSRSSCLSDLSHSFPQMPGIMPATHDAITDRVRSSPGRGYGGAGGRVHAVPGTALRRYHGDVDEVIVEAEPAEASIAAIRARAAAAHAPGQLPVRV